MNGDSINFRSTSGERLTSEQQTAELSSVTTIDEISVDAPKIIFLLIRSQTNRIAHRRGECNLHTNTAKRLCCRNILVPARSAEGISIEGFSLLVKYWWEKQTILTSTTVL